MSNFNNGSVILKFDTPIVILKSDADKFGDFYSAHALGYKVVYARTPERALAFMLDHMSLVYLGKAKKND